MSPFLTPEQEERYAEFQAFAAAEIAPHAADWDRAQSVGTGAIDALRRGGYLGASIPVEYGGKGWDIVSFGLLHEATGRADSALTDYLTVQAMVSSAIAKWGTAEQRSRWLPALADGTLLGGFALTEPGGGSDLTAMTTIFRRSPGDHLILDGEKRWISAAQMAGVFLVFGQLEGRPVACLVPRDATGIEVEPIRDLLGFRAAGLASVKFRDVRVGADAIIGKPGFALSHVAAHGLHIGRISTACSALGLLRACLEASATRAGDRQVGDRKVGDFGMIHSMLARMGTAHEAARGLCWTACRLTDENQPGASTSAMLAKYFASRAVAEAASDAVQIHGASGCQQAAAVERFYRNAKIMEIIEGTTQVHEAVLGRAQIDSRGRRAAGQPTASSPRR